MRSLLVVVLLLLALPVRADERVRAETRVQDVREQYGLTGEGVLVAVFDRGIDPTHRDFRNADGTTRLLAIYDLIDDAGAGDADNPTSFGTVYTRAEIDAALSAGTPLGHRDAVGHGVATAGIAGGNGAASDGRYAGMAPDVEFVIVKFTSEGAPAHGSEPAEAPFYRPDLLPVALDYVIGLAEAEGKPLVVLANFGSSGGPMDGTSARARDIDARFGPGFPGRVFITGSSDDGGVDNHAAGAVNASQSIDLEIEKASTFLRLDLWYAGSDRLTVEVVAPDGTVNGPYVPPGNGARASASGPGFTLFHNGVGVDFWGATNGRRELLIDFNSATTGTYTVRLTGTSVSDGGFQASLNPSSIISTVSNRFATFAVPGYTVWDWASAQHNLSPNAYVLRDTWTDVDGTTRTNVGSEVGPGALWPGSGVGPTYDGRLGVAVSVPGNTNIGAYGARSFFNSFRGNVIQDGDDPYGVLGAVSGGAPVLTGIVALMLQADPTLDAAEVRAILEQTARADAFTGTVPNPQWGYGKVDALAAVEEVLRGTDAEEVGAPQTATLSAYPNPTFASATVAVTLSEAADVRAEVFDLLGCRVAMLHDGLLAAGTHPLALDAAQLPAGVYVVRLDAEGLAATQRLTVVR
ncbi:MAG: S8 family serine peptidase [Bacteroidota bacterium]